MARNASIIVVFAVYLFAMFCFGVFFYRRNDTISDYLLGGKRLNKWVTSLSAEASDMSGWLLMGLPGAAYISGMSSAWIALGLLTGTYLNWRFTAHRLRRYTGLSDSIITLSDYLEYRFRDGRKMLRVMSALFILIFFLIYTASGFVASGKLFSAVFGIHYEGALLIGALVVVSYTFLGGFNAVCWTDFFQGSLMFFSIILVPVTGLIALGGPAAASSILRSCDPGYFGLFNVKGASSGLALAGVIVSSAAWGLGYFGQPHILVRFMAIRSAGDIRGARHIAVTWVLVSLAAAVAVGMIGRAYLPPGLEGADVEKVYIAMVNQLFPALVAGVFLSAILAAIMSTADSQLLITASAIAEDFYKPFLRKRASDRELVWVSRGTVLGASAVALVLAWNPNTLVLEMVAYAWAGFGAAFGPVVLLSLYWRRMNRAGALAGMITGGVTVLLWKQLHGGIFDVYEIVPGFLFSTIAIVIGSLGTTAPSKAIVEEFDAFNQEA